MQNRDCLYILLHTHQCIHVVFDKMALFYFLDMFDPKNNHILGLIGHYLSVSKSPRDKDVRRLVLTLAKGHGKSLKESREETFRRVLGVSKVMQYLEKLTDHAGIDLGEDYSDKDKIANSQSYSHIIEYEHQKTRGKLKKKIETQKKSSVERTLSRVVERQKG